MDKSIYAERYCKALARAREIETALDTIAESGGRKSISFDSGEGKQVTQFESPIVMQKWLEQQYQVMENMIRKMQPGGGLVNLNMRRHNYLNVSWRMSGGVWTY